MTAGLETFAKVRALHDAAATPGERAAAAAKMQTLARKVGLTVEQAASKLDAEARAAARPAPPPPRNPFEELFNSPEFRAKRAEREAKRAARRAEALAEYGSEEAVWEPCEMERALREACRPIIIRRPIIGGEMDTLQGWDGGPNLPPDARAAVAGGYPLPDTVHGAWAEYRYWEKRYADHEAFCPDIDPPLVVRARQRLLEGLLDTMPARSLRDTRARLDWMQHVLDLGFSRDVLDDQACLTALRGDIERMAALIRDQDTDADGAQSGQERTDPAPLSPGPVQSGRHEGFARSVHPQRRTNADKRRAVLDLLQADVGKADISPLSDREIARRAGVSPQTVGNIRRSLA